MYLANQKITIKKQERCLRVIISSQAILLIMDSVRLMKMMSYQNLRAIQKMILLMMTILMMRINREERKKDGKYSRS